MSCGGQRPTGLVLCVGNRARPMTGWPNGRWREADEVHEDGIFDTVLADCDGCIGQA